MVATIKFSDFDDAALDSNTLDSAGLESGVNIKTPKYPVWDNTTRPPSPFNGLLGYNAETMQYEYWDETIPAWVELQDSGNIPIFGAAGTILRSDGTGWKVSTFTMADTYPINRLVYANAVNALESLPTANNGVLVTSGIGAPSIESTLPDAVQLNITQLGTIVTGVWNGSVISEIYGGTNQSSYLLGDTLYASAANTLSKLAGNITTAKQYLSQTGDGALSAAPAWATISGGDITGAALTEVDDTNVTMVLGGSASTALLRSASMTLGWTGTLAVSRGGIGSGSLTANGLLLGQGTSPVTSLVLTDGQIAIGVTGADPSAAAIGSGTGILVGNGPGSITVSLAAIADQRILANISGGSLAPSANTLTAIIDACIGSTQGDLLYRNGSAWVVLAPGTLGQFLQTQGAAANPLWVTSATVTPAALTRVDDTNVTVTLGGTPATALLQATSLTLGWTGQLSVDRGGTGLAAVTSHYLPIGNGTSPLTLLAPNATSGIPLISQGAAADPTYGTAVVSGGGTGNTTFTAYSVICAGTTATGAFQNVSGVGTLNQVLISQGAGALPQWGSVPGVTPAALTKVDDTNVTLTLGGTPTTALLQATSITAGWTGQLGLTRGGTNASLVASNGGIVYSTASAMGILSGTATANQVLLSGSSTTPAWSTATYPATTTVNQLLYSSSANVIAGLATGNNGTLITSAGGVPSISSTLPTAVQGNITKLGTQSQALNMGTNLINNVVDPVSAQDAATKSYVDSQASTSEFPYGYINGFTLTNDSGDANHDIAMQIGQAKDNANVYRIYNSATIVKQIDFTWAAGTNQGGLGSGLSLTINTWYHFFVIYNPGTGAVDAGFDTSTTATNLLSGATGYTSYRRVGSVLTNVSANIIAFIQIGDEFYWSAPPADINGTVTTTVASYTLSVPPDYKCISILNILTSKASNNPTIYLHSPDVSDQAPSATVGTSPQATWATTVVTTVGGGGPFRIPTSTAKQIQARSNVATASFGVATIGWKDFRGTNNQ